MAAVSAVVLLEPVWAIADGEIAGRSVHGWFLRCVSQCDRAAAAVLHANVRHKPFTISPAFCAEHVGRGLWWFRVTSVFDPLSDWLLTWRAEAMAEVKLGCHTFRVLRVTTDGSEHPWAGRARLSDDASVPERAVRRVQLHFHTPTAFRGEKCLTLFPEPRLVYRSLAEKWNEYGAPQIRAAAIETLCSSLRVDEYKLETAAVPGVRRLEKGFTGYLDLSLMDSPSGDAACWLNRLSGFALYAGVGQKTTMGMGQVTATTP